MSSSSSAPSPAPTPTPTTAPTTAPTTLPSPPAAGVYTRAELERHSVQHDTCIIIDNQVYNVTQFLNEHPGGVEILLDNAGKDASECFHDIGHSQDAKELMKKFHVGEVAEEDRWEVKKRDVSWQSFDSGDSLQGLISAWLPPLTLGAVATVLYVYLFG